MPSIVLPACISPRIYPTYLLIILDEPSINLYYSIIQLKIYLLYEKAYNILKQIL